MGIYLSHTTQAYLRHFENEDLIRVVTLIWEHISLDVSPVAKVLELCDVIYNVKQPQVLNI